MIAADVRSAKRSSWHSLHGAINVKRNYATTLRFLGLGRSRELASAQALARRHNLHSVEPMRTDHDAAMCIGEGSEGEAIGNAMAVVRALELLRRPCGRTESAANQDYRMCALKNRQDRRRRIGITASRGLPEVWLPDANTERLRRQVAARSQVIRHRTRIKNEVHSIVHAHPIPRCPHDLFGEPGQRWPERQVLPDDERVAIEQRLRDLDHLGENLVRLIEISLWQ